MISEKKPLDTYVAVQNIPSPNAIGLLIPEKKISKGFNHYTRVIFYVRRIWLYLYKYRIHGTITIYILKGLAPVYHLI